MKAEVQKARAALLERAQDLLDGQLGQEIVAPFVGRDVDDFLVKKIRRAATEKLRAESPDFAPLRVSVDVVEGKLVMLTARFEIRR